MGENLG